ncbi:hypothetical protein QE152_g31860 [Popillia japonica]|uniref:Uncharacterized protein n=1 Tax=Popillia japonica TaxID=7064 RepID=A0AAW1J142_POPJA
MRSDMIIPFSTETTQRNYQRNEYDRTLEIMNDRFLKINERQISQNILLIFVDQDIMVVFAKQLSNNQQHSRYCLKQSSRPFQLHFNPSTAELNTENNLQYEW